MRKTLIIALKLVITALVFVFVVNRFGWESIRSNLGSAKFQWLGAALIVFVASVFLGVVQWHLLLESRGIRITFGRAVSLYFMGMFFHHFVFGAAAGDAVRVAFIKYGEGGSGRSGIAATFLDRFAGLWAMLGFAIIGGALLLWRGVVSGKTLTTAVLALFAAFFLFSGIQAFLVSRRLQAIFFALLDRFPIPRKQTICDIARETILEAGDTRLIVKVAVLSITVQTLRIGVHILCGASLGLLTGANFHYFFVFVPVLAMLLMVPLPFGVREGVEGTLFGLAGFRPEAAMVMAFLASMVGIVASCPGAGFFLMGKAQLKQVTVNENLSGDPGVQ